MLTATVRAVARAAGPEGPLLGALLALGILAPVTTRVAPLIGLVATAAAATGLVVGWRFGRGRVILGLLVVAAAAILPAMTPGPARSLMAVLVPLDLALLGLLPDRGIATRGGMVWLGVLVLQATAVVLLLGAGPDPALLALARLRVPPLDVTVDSAVLAYAVAIAALALRAAAGGAAPARGLLWAAVAALAIQAGHPAGAVFLVTAGALVLVVAALEDAHALAYRDALTGLPSRRALDELLERTSRRYTLAMIDVDHFKQFNDRHGHDVGDQVLQMVAARLGEVGGGARAFRYGGEEFTLVFRGRTLEEALPFLEEARASIETATFVVRGPNRPRKKPRARKGTRKGRSRERKERKGLLLFRPRRQQLSVTVSVGAAERSERTRSPAEMIQAADAALYRAKRKGRNRVVA